MADTPDNDTAAEDAGAAADDAGAAADRPAVRPSPAASAASRARRIGGAPRRLAATSGRGSATADADGATAEKTAADGVDLGKESGATAEQPAAAVGTADTSEADTEPAAAPGTEPAAPAAVLPFWVTWAPAVILIAGALAMAVIVAIVSHGVWWADAARSQQSVNALRQQVEAAAKTCLATTNTYKYTALDEFEKAGSACTTGTQTTQFRKAVDTLIRPSAPKLKFTQTAQINKAGIESVSGGQWTILLYGQLAVTNVNQPKGRTDPFAAVVRMQKVHGKWLIASLRTVSSPVN